MPLFLKRQCDRTPGAICYDDASPPQLSENVETCRGSAYSGTVGQTLEPGQPVVFGCIDYYSARCQYDVTNGDVGYMFAMRQFAQCTDVTPEPVGYCHGALKSAEAGLDEGPQSFRLP